MEYPSSAAGTPHDAACPARHRSIEALQTRHGAVSMDVCQAQRWYVRPLLQHLSCSPAKCVQSLQQAGTKRRSQLACRIFQRGKQAPLQFNVYCKLVLWQCTVRLWLFSSLGGTKRPTDIAAHGKVTNFAETRKESPAMPAERCLVIQGQGRGAGAR